MHDWNGQFFILDELSGVDEETLKKFAEGLARAGFRRSRHGFSRSGERAEPRGTVTYLPVERDQVGSTGEHRMWQRCAVLLGWRWSAEHGLVCRVPDTRVGAGVVLPDHALVSESSAELACAASGVGDIREAVGLTVRFSRLNTTEAEVVSP